MKNLKNFIDELSKHKWLTYFTILGGLTIFFKALLRLNILRYIFSDLQWIVALPLIFTSLEVFASIFLVIFSLKLLKSSFLKVVSEEKILIIFLALYGTSFVFTGLSGIEDLLDWVPVSGDMLLHIFGTIAILFAGAFLVISSWDLLKKKNQAKTIIIKN